MDIKKKLIEEGFVEGDFLIPQKKNFFIAIATGLIENPVDQLPLGEYTDNFVVCYNIPERDTNWDNPEDLKASMAGPDENGPGHVFIASKRLDWDCFNVKTMTRKHIPFLERMHEAGKKYAVYRQWSRPGFIFHRWPHNTVYSLHMHVINLDRIGHTYVMFPYKHEHIEGILKKLTELS